MSQKPQDIAKYVIIDLSLVRSSTADMGLLRQRAEDFNCLYNASRDLLLVEVPTSQQKLRFLKALPQRLWSSGSVILEFSPALLKHWLAHARPFEWPA